MLFRRVEDGACTFSASDEQHLPIPGGQIGYVFFDFIICSDTMEGHVMISKVSHMRPSYSRYYASFTVPVPVDANGA